MRPKIYVVAAMLAIAAGHLGCNGAAGGSSRSTAPGSSNNPPAPSGSGSVAIARAAFASVTSSGRAAMGDTLTVSFATEVVLSKAVDPAVEFVLPVNGNSFGAGAT